MWFNPKSRVFIVWIVMLFLVAIVCFKSGALTNGVLCAVFGAIGLRMYLKSRRE
ncbi:MAG: hypothetical protein Q4D81_07880 [Eubacteriales bacterium]|nr:hypothetical protein [Eubacteriales bacterium]